jgi:hypothetical protein
MSNSISEPSKTQSNRSTKTLFEHENFEKMNLLDSATISKTEIEIGNENLEPEPKLVRINSFPTVSGTAEEEFNYLLRLLNNYMD